MTTGWIFAVVGAGTYLIRVSAIGLVGQGLEIPPRVERTLRLILPAVLSSIIANSLLLDHGGLNGRTSWYLGTAVATAVVWRLRSAAWAMSAAMAVVWVLQRLGLR